MSDFSQDPSRSGLTVLAAAGNGSESPGKPKHEGSSDAQAGGFSVEPVEPDQGSAQTEAESAEMDRDSRDSTAEPVTPVTATSGAALSLTTGDSTEPSGEAQKKEPPSGAEAAGEPVFTATRHDLHLTRRMFHMGNGILVATLYAVLFSHQQAISLLGTAAGLIYIFEQVRINYPEIQNRIPGFTNFFLRAEEQVKESAMLPYVIAVLLSIITFPKPIAIIAIYTLAIADPLAAVIGIRFGTKKIVGQKSLEGSAAFFTVTFLVTLIVLAASSPAPAAPIAVVALMVALTSSVFEMVPIRIDDNLTIPLFTGFIGWGLCALMKVPV